MTSKSSLIRTIENQRRQFFRMEQANKELKAQLEQQAKSIERLSVLAIKHCPREHRDFEEITNLIDKQDK